MREQDVKDILKPLEKIAGRGQIISTVFRDFVSLALYALCRDDPPYLEIMNRYHNDRPKGTRDADYFAEAFAGLIMTTERVNHDCLGDVYMWVAGNYSVKGMGQFFTPVPICDMMAGLTCGQGDIPESPTICDPACGSGRLLISAAKQLPPSARFTGTDLDSVCARMATLNLCLFNMSGVILHGNSISMDYYAGWITRRSPLGGRVRQMGQEELEEYVAVKAPAIKQAAEQKKLSQPKPTEKLTARQAEGQLTLF